MSIFFPPPPPFVGGAQPYAPAKLNPQLEAVAVNNPPVGYPAVVINTLIAVEAAQPDPWQRSELGAVTGFGPYGARQLNASLLNNAPVANNPPGTGTGNIQLAAAIAWLTSYTLPELPPKLLAGLSVDKPPKPNQFVPAPIPDSTLPQLPPKLLAGLSVDTPPPAANIQVAAAISWVVPYTLPLLPPKLLSGLSVDNPPSPSRFVPPPVADSTLPQLPKLLATGLPVNNPPFFNGASEQLLAITGTWIPPAPLPTLPNNLSPALLATVANNPPFFSGGNWTLATILSAWVPPPPPPTLSPKLSPALTAVPVNNPPVSTVGALQMVNIINAWVPFVPLPVLPPLQTPPSGPAVSLIVDYILRARRRSRR